MASLRPRRGPPPSTADPGGAETQPPATDASVLAQNAPLPSGNAHWTREDEERFIAFVWEHRSEGEGVNFKTSPTWNAAARHMNETLTKGGAKTAAGCKGKWAAFKKLFELIELVKSQSGWTWTDDGGACITSETASTWDDWVVKNGDCARFRNKGWHHLAAFAPFMEGVAAKGAHVWRSSQSVAPVANPVPETPTQETDQQGDGDRYSPPWGSFNERDDEDDRGKSSSPFPETPIPQSRKRTSASSAPADSSGAKKVRVNGPTAIADLSQSVVGFGQVIREAFVPHSASGLEATPRRKQQAILRAQKAETYLSVDELVSFINILEKDIDSVDSYMVLKHDALRRRWVESKLGIN